MKIRKSWRRAFRGRFLCAAATGIARANGAEFFEAEKEGTPVL